MTLTVADIVRPDGLVSRSFVQSAAGTDAALIADPGAGYAVKIVSLVVSVDDLAGTLKLTSGSTDLTGPMALEGAVWFQGSSRNPFMYGVASEAVGLVSTGGVAAGTIVFRNVPA